MTLITIHNAISKVDTSDDILRHLREHLSYEVEGSVFARKAVPMWDGRVRLMDKRGFYPTGLTSRLMGYLERREIPYSLADKRIKPSKFISLKGTYGALIPRDYQMAAAAISDANNRGVYEVGVGGGKTFIAGLIIERRAVPTLFVTPDTGLRQQAYDSLIAWFGHKNVDFDIETKKPIIVANIQNLIHKKPKLFKRFEMLMVDEFHHSAAKSYKKLNTWIENAYYRYGFTGTFMRPDGRDMDMHGVLSNVIFSKTTSELIEEGYLCRPYISIVKFDVPKEVKRYNYKMAYEWIVQDPKFNAIVAGIACDKIDEGKQTLILVRRIAHGAMLNDMIPGSYFLNGEDEGEYRESIKKKFIRKEIRCLIATNIFGEGQNCPSIDVLINARAQKTEVQTVQGIGRALRKSKGKEKAEVFDFLITGQRNLQRHSIERVEVYREEPAFKISFRRA